MNRLPLVLLALTGLVGPVLAARPQEQEPAVPAAPTLEEVQEHFDELAAREDLDPAFRSAIEARYTAARVSLESAERWAVKAAAFEAGVQSAPAELDAAQTELAQPLPTPQLGLEPDATLEDIEQGLRIADARLVPLRDEIEDLEAEPERRAQRLTELPQLVAEAATRLDAAGDELALPTPEGLDPLEVEARLFELRALRDQLTQEVRTHRAELASHQARRELLTAKRNVAERRLAIAQAERDAWYELAVARREEVKREAEREAEEAERAVESVHPALQELAQRNAELARMRSDFAGQVEELDALASEARVQRDQIQGDMQDALDRIAVAGLTTEVGLILREQNASLPAIEYLHGRIDLHERRIAEVQLERLERQKESRELADLDARTAELLDDLPPETTSGERSRLEAQARTLLADREAALDLVIEDERRLFLELGTVLQVERELTDALSQFRSFIDARVLWIPSSPPLWEMRFETVPESLAWFATPFQADLGAALVAEVRENTFHAWTVIVVLVALWSLQKPLRRRLAEAGKLARQSSCRSLRPTLRAVVQTLLIAAVVPLTLLFLAWRVEARFAPDAFAMALTAGLSAIAFTYLRLEILRQLCRPGGLGEAHFAWRPECLSQVRRSLRPLWGLAVPGFFLAAMLDAQSNAAWKQELGALSLVAYFAGLTWFLHRVLSPRGAIANRWSTPTRRLVYAGGVLPPLALGVLAAVGYSFTALELMRGLQSSLMLAIACVLGYAVAARWLLLAQRNLAYRRLVARLRAEREEAHADVEPEIKVVEEEMDLTRVAKETRALLRSFLMVGALVFTWTIWADVLPALGFLDRVELWTTTQTISEESPTSGEMVQLTVQAPVTLTMLLSSLAVLLLTLLAYRNLPGTLEVTILERLSIQRGERYAFTTLVRYGIVVVGIFVALQLLDVTWSKLQWLVAAVSVGLGFGLQEIFANFISGLILLFERPLRVGDFVTVGETDGRVTRIRIRATTITDWDRREMIVPNKEFVTGRMVNWSLSDPITRIVIPVGVAYGSDTPKAERILLEIAAAAPHVLDKPEPTVVFTKFGDSALDLRLRVFIPDRDLWAEVTNQLHTAIDARFREAGVVIAFPQRDLHLKTAGPLEEIVKAIPGLRVEEFGGSRS